MDILDKILQYKKGEIETQKGARPISLLEKSEFFERETISLAERLKNPFDVGMIAEFKRKSPSKGWIAEDASVMSIVAAYESAGVSGVSVLTDRNFFAGGNEYLTIARRCIDCPILRKEFIIDEYQVIEAKSIGADVILLIAAALPKHRIVELAKLAKSLGLEVLLEIHDLSELSKWCPEVDIMGVNNRNLKTFEVSIQNSLDLKQQFPKDWVCISESGLKSIEEIKTLRTAGFNGFLIGETFMKTPYPGDTCRKLLMQLNQVII